MRIVKRKSFEWLTPGIGSKIAPSILGMDNLRTRQETKADIVMRLVELEQNSPAWLKWREGGIGASESAAILQLNPWESRDKAKERKLGRDKYDDNTNTRRGKRREPDARDWYEDLMGWSMPPVCGIHDKYDWMRASLDGMRQDGQLILEIKCPTPRWHNHTVECGIPDWYYCQIQHQFAVSGATKCHFVSWCPEYHKQPRLLLTVKRDEEFIEILIPELERFWNEVTEARIQLRQCA